MPRDTADPDDAADAAAALVRVAWTQLQRAHQADDPQSADDAHREAAAAGLEAGNPRGREIAADALVRRALAALLVEWGLPQAAIEDTRPQPPVCHTG